LKTYDTIQITKKTPLKSNEKPGVYLKKKTNKKNPKPNSILLHNKHTMKK